MDTNSSPFRHASAPRSEPPCTTSSPPQKNQSPTHPDAADQRRGSSTPSSLLDEHNVAPPSTESNDAPLLERLSHADILAPSRRHTFSSDAHVVHDGQLPRVPSQRCASAVAILASSPHLNPCALRVARLTTPVPSSSDAPAHTTETHENEEVACEGPAGSTQLCAEDAQRCERPTATLTTSSDGSADVPSRDAQQQQQQQQQQQVAVSPLELTPSSALASPQDGAPPMPRRLTTATIARRLEQGSRFLARLRQQQQQQQQCAQIRTEEVSAATARESTTRALQDAWELMLRRGFLPRAYWVLRHTTNPEELLIAVRFLVQAKLIFSLELPEATAHPDACVTCETSLAWLTESVRTTLLACAGAFSEHTTALSSDSSTTGMRSRRSPAPMATDNAAAAPAHSTPTLASSRPLSASPSPQSSASHEQQQRRRWGLWARSLVACVEALNVPWSSSSPSASPSASVTELVRGLLLPHLETCGDSSAAEQMTTDVRDQRRAQRAFLTVLAGPPVRSAASSPYFGLSTASSVTTIVNAHDAARQGNELAVHNNNNDNRENVDDDDDVSHEESLASAPVESLLMSTVASEARRVLITLRSVCTLLRLAQGSASGSDTDTTVVRALASPGSRPLRLFLLRKLHALVELDAMSALGFHLFDATQEDTMWLSATDIWTSPLSPASSSKTAAAATTGGTAASAVVVKVAFLHVMQGTVDWVRSALEHALNDVRARMRRLPQLEPHSKSTHHDGTYTALIGMLGESLHDTHALAGLLRFLTVRRLVACEAAQDAANAHIEEEEEAVPRQAMLTAAARLAATVFHAAVLVKLWRADTPHLPLSIAVEERGADTPLFRDERNRDAVSDARWLSEAPQLVLPLMVTVTNTGVDALEQYVSHAATARAAPAERTTRAAAGPARARHTDAARLTSQQPTGVVAHEPPPLARWIDTPLFTSQTDPAVPASDHRPRWVQSNGEVDVIDLDLVIPSSGERQLASLPQLQQQPEEEQRAQERRPEQPPDHTQLSRSLRESRTEAEARARQRSPSPVASLGRVVVSMEHGVMWGPSHLDGVAVRADSHAVASPTTSSLSEAASDGGVPSWHGSFSSSSTSSSSLSFLGGGGSGAADGAHSHVSLASALIGSRQSSGDAAAQDFNASVPAPLVPTAFVSRPRGARHDAIAARDPPDDDDVSGQLLEDTVHWQHPLRRLCHVTAVIVSLMDDLLPTALAANTPAKAAATLRWLLSLLQSTQWMSALWRCESILNKNNHNAAWARSAHGARLRLAAVLTSTAETPAEKLAAHAVLTVSLARRETTTTAGPWTFSSDIFAHTRAGDLSILAAGVECNWLYLLARLTRHDASLAFNSIFCAPDPVAAAAALPAASHCRALWLVAVHLARAYRVVQSHDPIDRPWTKATPRVSRGEFLMRVAVQRPSQTTSSDKTARCGDESGMEAACVEALLRGSSRRKAAGLLRRQLITVLQVIVSAQTELSVHATDQKHHHHRHHHHAHGATAAAATQLTSLPLSLAPTFALQAEDLSLVCDVIMEDDDHAPTALPGSILRALLHPSTICHPHGHRFCCPLWNWPPPPLRRVLGEVLAMSATFENNESSALVDPSRYRVPAASTERSRRSPIRCATEADAAHQHHASQSSSLVLWDSVGSVNREDEPHPQTESQRRQGASADGDMAALYAEQSEERALVTLQMVCLRSLRPPAHCPRTALPPPSASAIASSDNGVSASPARVASPPPSPPFESPPRQSFSIDLGDVSHLFPPRDETQNDLAFLASELSILEFIKTILSSTREVALPHPGTGTTSSACGPRATTHPIFALMDRATWLLEWLSASSSMAVAESADSQHASPPRHPLSSPQPDEGDDADAESTHTVVAPFTAASTTANTTAVTILTSMTPYDTDAMALAETAPDTPRQSPRLSELEASAIWLSACDDDPDAMMLVAPPYDDSRTPTTAESRQANSSTAVVPESTPTTSVVVRTCDTRRALAPLGALAVSDGALLLPSTRPSSLPEAAEPASAALLAVEYMIFGSGGGGGDDDGSSASSSRSQSPSGFGYPPSTPASFMEFVQTGFGVRSHPGDVFGSYDMDDNENDDDDVDDAPEMSQAPSVSDDPLSSPPGLFHAHHFLDSHVTTTTTPQAASLTNSRASPLGWHVCAISESDVDECEGTSVLFHRRTHQLHRCLAALGERVRLVYEVLMWLQSAVSSPDFHPELLLRREWAFVFLRLCKFIGLAMNSAVRSDGAAVARAMRVLGAPPGLPQEGLAVYRRFDKIVLELFALGLDIVTRIVGGAARAPEEDEDDAEVAAVPVTHRAFASSEQNAAQQVRRGEKQRRLMTKKDSEARTAPGVAPSAPRLVMATTTYYPTPENSSLVLDNDDDDSEDEHDDNGNAEGEHAVSQQPPSADPSTPLQPSSTVVFHATSRNVEPSSAAAATVPAAPPPLLRPPRQTFHCETHAAVPRGSITFGSSTVLLDEDTSPSSSAAAAGAFPTVTDTLRSRSTSGVGDGSLRRRTRVSVATTAGRGSLRQAPVGTSHNLPQFSALTHSEREERARSLYTVETFLISALRRELETEQTELFAQWWTRHMEGERRGTGGGGGDAGGRCDSRYALTPQMRAAVTVQLQDLIHDLKQDEPTTPTYQPLH